MRKVTLKNLAQYYSRTVNNYFNLIKIYEIHTINNSQQTFFTIVYLDDFILTVVVALPSYTLRSLLSKTTTKWEV
jgi:hypothetical protein